MLRWTRLFIFALVVALLSSAMVSRADEPIADDSDDTTEEAPAQPAGNDAQIRRMIMLQRMQMMQRARHVRRQVEFNDDSEGHAPSQQKRRPIMPPTTQPSTASATQPATGATTQPATQAASTTTAPATQPASDHADARVIAAVKTWGDLLKRPAINLGDGSNVRLGIDATNCTADGGVMVYGLFEGLGVYETVNHGADLMLGPLRVASDREAREEVAEDVLPEAPVIHPPSRPLIRVAPGRHLFAAHVPMQDATLMYIDVKHVSGKRLASAEIKNNGHLRHPWTPFAGYRLGKAFRGAEAHADYVKLLAVAAKKGKPASERVDVQVYAVEETRATPVVQGEAPLWSEPEKSPFAESRVLPSVDAPRDPTIKAEYENGLLTLTMPGGLMIDDVVGQVLLRWWVNGEPFVPTPVVQNDMHEYVEPEEMGGTPLMGALHAAPLGMSFAIDPESLGVKPGDRVGVQAMYVPFGWYRLGVSSPSGHWFRARYSDEPADLNAGSTHGGGQMPMQISGDHEHGDGDSSAAQPVDVTVAPPLGDALATSNRVDFVLSDTPRIPVTRTWGDLLRLKPIDAGDGATVRFGIETTGVHANGRVLVYAMTHRPEGGKNQKPIEEPGTQPLGALTVFVERPEFTDAGFIDEIPVERPRRNVKLVKSDEAGASGLYIASIDVAAGERLRVQVRKSDGAIVATQWVNGLEIPGGMWMPLARVKPGDDSKAEEKKPAPEPPRSGVARRTPPPPVTPPVPPATQPAPPATQPAVKPEPGYAPIVTTHAWPKFPKDRPLFAFDPDASVKPDWLRDDAALPGLASQTPTPGFKLMIENGTLFIVADPPIFLAEKATVVTEHFLVSLSVLGDPLQPREDENGGAPRVVMPRRMKAVITPITPEVKPLTRMGLALRLDSRELGLHKGDRVGVRVMYCPNGFETMEVNDGEEKPQRWLDEMLTPPAPPRVSNTVEIVVK